MTELPSIPETVPVLPNREAVVFPGMLVPLAIRNERWVRAVDSVASGHKTLAFFFQAEPVEPLTVDSLPQIGCAAAVVSAPRRSE